MKKTTKYLLGVCTLLALGCTDSGTEGPSGPVRMTFTAAVETRAVDVTASLDGDGGAMSVLLARGGESLPAEHVRFVSSGGQWCGDPEQWLRPGESATLYALHPWREQVEDPGAVPLDVAAQTDYLFSSGQVTHAQPSCNLAMRHLLAVLAFNLSTEDYDGEGVLEQVRLSGFPLKGVLDPATCRIDLSQRGDFAFDVRQPVRPDGWHADVPSLWSLPFTPGEGEVVVTLVVDGKPYDCPLPRRELLGGVRYLFRAVLTPRGATILGDQTQTTPLDERTDTPAALSYGRLRLTRAGRDVAAPLIAGEGFGGVIFWTDLGGEPYAPSATYRYDDDGPHTLLVETWNAREATFDLRGVSAVDFSEF